MAEALAKTVRQECESAKVAVRHARRGALEQGKKLKEKDAKHGFEKQVCRRQNILFPRPYVSTPGS